MERLLRQLEPLMPGRVTSWRRHLDLVESETRGLLQQQILITAHQVFGDFRNRLLLSLPSKKVAAGIINLGTIYYEQPKWPVGITTTELLQNLAIFGRSGAGKTNLAFHLLQQLNTKRIPFLFLDWKRTARHLAPGLNPRPKIYTPGRKLAPFAFNPFIPPTGIEPQVYANLVIDLMGDAYTLGDAARSVLQKALRTAYATGNLTPNVAELLEQVDQLPDKERIRGWKISAIRALETLAMLDLAPDQANQDDMVRTIAEHSSIIELDALSAANKAFLLPMLCLWVYYHKLASKKREQLGLVIFVEEAHHVLYRSKGHHESVMEMLLRQCRELGIAIIVIDQHPHLISSAALGNTFTSICLNLKDPKDISKAAAVSLMESTDSHHLSMLPVGQAVVKLQARWQRPFLIQIPHVKITKGAVTDDAIPGLNQARQTLSAPRAPLALPNNTRAGSRGSDGALTTNELCFVNDVLQHQDDGVDKRYRRLGMSSDKGNRLKRSLLGKGVLAEQPVALGRTRRCLLRVTADARKELGLESSQDRGSLVHEYWKRWYALKLRQAGYYVQFEAPRNKGFVDVLGTRASESVAIEVETGKSDVVHNVRQDLLSGFRKVIVVATNDHAKAIVERQLAAAGLLCSRVRIVLRDTDCF